VKDEEDTMDKEELLKIGNRKIECLTPGLPVKSGIAESSV